MPEPRVKLGIDGDPAKARAAIAETIRGLEGMQKAVNAYSATGVRAFRAEAEASRQLLTQLGATQREHEKLAGITQRFDNQVEAARGRSGMALRQMAMGFDQIARSGSLAGDGMKQIIASGSEMAFMFGAAGTAAGAAGIGILALMNAVSKHREEVEKANEKQREFNELLLKGPRDALEAEKATLAARVRFKEAEVAQIEAADKAARERGDGTRGSLGGSTIVGPSPAIETAKRELAELKRSLEGVTFAVQERTRAEERQRELEELFEGREKARKEAEAAARGADEATQQLSARLTLLDKAAQHEATRADAIFYLGAVEDDLRKQLEAGNMTLHRRLVLLDMLARVEAARAKARPEIRKQDQLEPVDRTSIGVGISRPDVLGQIGADAEAAVENLPSIWEEIQQNIKQATEATQHFDSAIADVASGGIMAFADATQAAFEAWVSGSGSAGRAFRGALLGSIRDAAATKGKFYLAESFGDLARGIMGDPRGFAAAAQDVAASAAMFAIAGAAGANAGGRTAGDAGASSVKGDSAAVSSLSRAKRTVVLETGGTGIFDMNNPAVRDGFVQMLRDAGEFGETEIIVR